MKFKLKNPFKKLTPKAKKLYPKTTQFVQKRPLASLFVSLGVLLALIAIGNFFFTPKIASIQANSQPKKVQTFNIGTSPKITTQAQIDKSGVVEIMAQNGGIVGSISVTEGQQVAKGANLLNLNSTYDGKNAGGIQTAIAAKQYNLAKDTFNTQKEIIQKQREVATQSAANADRLREISNQSAEDSRNLAELNFQILETINQNLTDLQATNVGGSNDAAIAQTKQMVLQYQSSLTQARSAQRNLELQGSNDQPPAALAALQQDIALKQLDIQEKSLQNNKEISALQLSLASIQASLMHPVAPFASTVQRVLVHPGQSVTPGTVLVILNGESQDLTAVAKVSASVAQKLTSFEASKLYIAGQTLELQPSFVSSVPTDGLLYSVIFELPVTIAAQVTDKDYIKVELPVGLPDTISSNPYIPLDAVFQTQEQSFIFVNQDGQAQVREVTLGEITGSFVQITKGLNSGDKVITSRNVIEGESVEN